MIIANKYKLINPIGNGAFSKIYEGENIRTGEKVAVKIESLEDDTKLLKNETKVYHYLQCVVKPLLGIPIVKWYGSDYKNYYMVLPLLGPSLKKIRENKILTMKTIMKIGYQIVERIETLHRAGLMHRDIKPDNFLLGSGRYNQTVYMIDYGFCKKYGREADNKIKPKRVSMIGTPNFASINTHMFLESERKDDIESIGYVLLYLYLGKLPWDINNISNEEMFNMKLNFIKENKLNETNIPKVFIDFLIISQKSFGTPKYDDLKKVLIDYFYNL
jgi:casein kinase 1